MTTGTTDGDSIELEVPLRSAFASPLRLVASSLGADAEFSVDEIEDLRLGLSEVFTGFADAATEAGIVGRLRADYLVDGRTVSIRLSPRPPFEPVLDEQALTILDAVVDAFVLDATSVTIVKHGSETADRSESPGP